MSDSGNICFIDFETTGINVFRDEPVEFGAILVNEDFQIINSFHSRIRIDKKVYLKKTAFQIHDISIEMLKDEPSQKDVLNIFFEKFGTNFRFAGWNITFDVSFMRRMCNRNSSMVNYNKINHRHLDIQTICYLGNEIGLFKEEVPQSLSDLCEYYMIERSSNHNALEDAKITFEVYKKLLAEFENISKH